MYTLNSFTIYKYEGGKYDKIFKSNILFIQLLNEFYESNTRHQCKILWHLFFFYFFIFFKREKRGGRVRLEYKGSVVLWRCLHDLNYAELKNIASVVSCWIQGYDIRIVIKLIWKYFEKLSCNLIDHYLVFRK